MGKTEFLKILNTHYTDKSLNKSVANELFDLSSVSKPVVCCPKCKNERLEKTGIGWYICRDMYCDWGGKL